MLVENSLLQTNFSPISLSEMEEVRLMNRTEEKYWFHQSKLEAILQEIQDDYYILEIDGISELPYATYYYDTENDKMYHDHHNGCLSRYKIRKRSYVASGISFLEVKMKNNKRRTIKNRIPTNFEVNEFQGDENNFLMEYSPFSGELLDLKLINNYSRITLVNRRLNERCTIDLGLQFEALDQKITIDDLVIAEIKVGNKPSMSSLKKALGLYQIRSSGFSKYCIGRSLTDPSMKHNAFKPKIRQLQKCFSFNI